MVRLLRWKIRRIMSEFHGQEQSLFDEQSFYPQFIKDLVAANYEVVIESPFITSSRMIQLWPVFRQLLDRNIQIHVFTRDSADHQGSMTDQAEEVIQQFEELGIQTFICKGNFHRKLALIDRIILWEGSLNILSQTKSREIMHRFDDKNNAENMFRFLKLERHISEVY